MDKDFSDIDQTLPRQNRDRIYSLYLIERWLYLRHLTFLSIIIRALIRIVFSCDIPYKATIGKRVEFPHDALGVVIHPDAVIGDDCKILHGATLGGRGEHIGVPVIGNNVTIGCHAQLMGPIKIGNNAIIGGGSVVVKDVPENSIVVGNPAEVIKIRESKVK